MTLPASPLADGLRRTTDEFNTELARLNALLKTLNLGVGGVVTKDGISLMYGKFDKEWQLAACVEGHEPVPIVRAARHLRVVASYLFVDLLVELNTQAVALNVKMQQATSDLRDALALIEAQR